METVPLADQSCHRAGNLTDDAVGVVCFFRWKLTAMAVVQPLASAHKPLVQAALRQAHAASADEKRRPLQSQGNPNSYFVPWVDSVDLTPLLFLQHLLSQVFRYHHVTTIVNLVFLMTTFAGHLLTLLTSATHLRYRQAGLRPLVTVRKSTNHTLDCDVSVRLSSSEEQSTAHRAGIRTGCQLTIEVSWPL